MNIHKLLTSKPLYWIAMILMVINILGYISIGSFECVIVFAIGYYVSNHFTKKYQALDILAGIFASNVIFGCGRIKEGVTGDCKSGRQIGCKAGCECTGCSRCKGS
jgi:hypothetical protein